MTITKLQTIRRLLLALLDIVNAELKERGALHDTMTPREYQQSR